ncbi:AfsR/SARP family transcriptional regulator [Streptomyces pinistramenti]|uniref:AfsR/SARP family transcriptional regulator n=1 Tax=Streptomyces pinistramenti TaxID=2884812 RepID=UPI001D077394|nr:BTAD domain-containing putative transcriptional regulator [Streptomyces pinistramenti]MCB5907164.1 AfsR family transcriptional regulator [Streptomyces pinistramenti]
MRYGILGTTQALRADGTPVALGGARLRALLTALALRPGRALPTDLLIADIWRMDPPADAPGALQALVGRLRRALGHEAVASADGGYRLCAAPEAVDLTRFERLAADGTRALADGEPARAAALLDDALALWRGPALADLPEARADAARAERRRLDAQRSRLAADLALGRADHALPALGALCQDHPLDEPLQALRLRALRDAGRTAEALAAYEEIRAGIADRLGADPGPELRALHAELLRPGPTPSGPLAHDLAAPGHDAPGHDVPASHPLAGPAPADRHRPAGPGPAACAGSGPDAAPAGDGTRHHHTRDETTDRHGHTGAHDHTAHHPTNNSTTGHSTTVHTGTGQHDAPAHGHSTTAHKETETGTGHHTPTAPTTFGTLAPGGGSFGAVPPYGNLRARLTSFVGRDSDLEALRGDLAAHRLVTLLGPGGAGKTRLSQEGAERAAAALPDAWPHGVWLAELAPVDDPQTVPETVLTVLGARETVVRGTTAEGLRAASDPTALDPLGRLAEHCADRRMLLVLDNCEHVIGAAAELAERLLAACPGVTVLATSREPLAVPGEVLRPVEPLPDPVALRLLADRGAVARPGFRVDDDPAACAEICRRLDGLPLAIELAAARLRMLSPRQLAERLDDRFRLLTSGSRTALPRQQTLRAVVDWSWDLLDAPERAVLRRLSVFAGGCDLPLADEVCAGEGVDGREIAALLGSLIDKSLVVAAPAPDGRMRYRLLETVGEYAGERLDEAGERAGAERRHLVAYRELARAADPLLRGPGQRGWLERLELEHDNLRTALRRAVAAEDEHEALCLVLSLQWFWSLRDHRADARTWSQAAAALGPNPFLPPVEPAPELYERPIDAPPPMSAEQLQEARREVRLVAMASVDSDIEALQSPRMQRDLEGVLAAYRSGMPQTCRVPGVMWFFAALLSGRIDELPGMADDAVRACREFGFEWELAFTLQFRAKIHNDRAGGLEMASRDADESLRLFVGIGDDWGVAEALAGRAEAREARGEYALAAQDYRAAMAYAEDLGAHDQTLLLRTRLAGVLIEDGQGEAGERLLREVLAQAGERNSGREAVPFAQLTLAMRLTSVGRLDEAREQLLTVRDAFAQRAPEMFLGLAESALVATDLEAGRLDRLPERLRSALAKMQSALTRMVAPDLPVNQLLTGAQVWLAVRGADAGRDAARLVGAYDALRSVSHVPPGIVRDSRAAAEKAARGVLGDAAYADAHAEGGGLSLEEATALI